MPVDKYYLFFYLFICLERKPLYICNNNSAQQKQKAMITITTLKKEIETLLTANGISAGFFTGSTSVNVKVSVDMIDEVYAILSPSFKCEKTVSFKTPVVAVTL